jgi:phospholipid/cholesterol/gamma-HCH transport system substrate-binding protein
MIVPDLRRKLAILLVFLAGCAVIFGYLLVQAGVRLPGTAQQQAYVTLPDGFQLVPQSDVREAGVKVGVVTSVDYQLAGGGVRSRVGLALDRPYRIFRNASVELRTKTLVGENYLELTPGTPASGPLPNGATLPLSHAIPSVQLDQVLSTFDRATRARIQDDLQSLGAGLAGHGGDLSLTLGAAGQTGRLGAEVLGTLDRQRGQVGAVVHDVSSVLQAFGDQTEAVRTLAVQADAAAGAAASRDAELASALEQLPGTLAQARATVTQLGSFAQRQTPVLADLTSIARQATPLFTDLGPTAARTRALFAALPAAMRQARPLLSQLVPLSRRLGPAMVALDSLLAQADPALGYLAPFSKELGSFFADNGAALGGTDTSGNFARVFPIVAASTFAGLSPLERKAIETLLGAGIGGKSAAEGTNPYPKPGTIADPQPASGTYPRLTALPPASFR